jgi:hypothetical protein
MTHTDPPPITIASPADLIEAIRQLFGSDPVESLVLVGVTDATVASYLRLDLGAIAWPGVLPAVFAATARSGASAVMAVVYTETAVRTSLLVEPITSAAEWAGLELLAALRVTGGRVRPLGADCPTWKQPPASPRRLRAVE